METATITEALRETVKEKGEDYIYVNPNGLEATYSTGTECFYSTDEGYPSCIVGHVIKRLDPEAFAAIVRREWEHEDVEEAGPESFGAGEALTFLDTEIPYEVETGLTFAQMLQDKGYSWGVAQAAYEAIIANPEEAALISKYDWDSLLTFLRKHDVEV